MTTSTRTRVARNVLGALAAFLLLLVGPGSVPAVGAATETDLIGQWDVLVTIYNQDPPQYAPLICTLSADHLVHCVSKPGLPPLVGQGIWNKAQESTFAFWITHHAQRDASGNPVGSIYAEHLGKFTRTDFTTTGYTYIDMHDGKPWIGPISVRGEAHRIG